jgi:SlyX protein
MPDHNELAKKLEALEIKLAFQEDTIDTLNDMVAKQDKEIQDLWAANRVLKQSLNDMKSGNEGDEPEPPPPHY